MAATAEEIDCERRFTWNAAAGSPGLNETAGSIYAVADYAHSLIVQPTLFLFDGNRRSRQSRQGWCVLGGA